MDASQIGKRAWSYAGVLQDAGLSCFEYVEQLTLLLFLKMADQLTQPPYEREPLVPPELGWQPLLRLDGEALANRSSARVWKRWPKSRECWACSSVAPVAKSQRISRRRRRCSRASPNS